MSLPDLFHSFRSTNRRRNRHSESRESRRQDSRQLLGLRFRQIERLEDRLAMDAQFLKDINATVGHNRVSGGYQEMAAIGDTVYFAWSDDETGHELWKSDGTAEGTVLVKDIFPGKGESLVRHLTNVGGTLYFQAEDGIHGRELWKSDGTAAGTTLVKDISPGVISSSPLHLIDVDGTLFFRALDDVHGYGLWKSDGTDAGTEFLTEIDDRYFSSPSHAGVDGNLYFATWFLDEFTFRFGFFRSDGTAEGTERVIEAQKFIYDLANVGETIFFGAQGYDDRYLLWKSDGTSQGTSVVKQLSGSPREFMSAHRTLFFSADDGIHGRELWKSDGTAAGTVLVADIVAGSISGTPISSNPNPVLAVGGNLLFLATKDYQEYLWRTDGTSQGTVRISDAPVRVRGTLEGKLLFSQGTSLWITDGTTEGTRTLVQDPYPVELAAIISNGSAGGHFFSISLGSNGAVIWKMDVNGKISTLRQNQAPSTSDSVFPNFVGVNGILYFTASAENGSQTDLWASDGTREGTYLIRNGGGPGDLTNVAGTLFFTATSDRGRRLWKYDGIEAGTVEVGAAQTRSGLRSLTAVGDTLYFLQGDASLPEIWKSDGTDEGTTFVAGGNREMSVPKNMRQFKDELVFVATNRDTGNDSLWASDGTIGGTRIIHEFAGSPTFLVVTPELIYFGYSDSGQLWRSDGTSTGTFQIATIQYTHIETSRPEFAAVDDSLFFMVYTPKLGNELWRTDGTVEGTRMVRDFHWGSGISNIERLTGANGNLYFRAWDQFHGYEIWKSDGTAEGTSRVSETLQGDVYGQPDWLTAHNGILYFNGDTFGDSVRQLWMSDGTEEGTRPVSDELTGGNLDPTQLISVGDKLFFVGNTFQHGKELWVVETPVDSDGDGVSDQEENVSGNSGDGNGDGIADATQPHVVSLQDAVSRSMLTLVGPEGSHFQNVIATQNPAPHSSPAGIDFPIGFLRFVLVPASAGESTAVTVLSQSSALLNTSYQYDRTADNSERHWYRFLSAASKPGVEFVDEGAIINLEDGQREDGDLTVNGAIRYYGAIGSDQRFATWHNPILAGDVNEDGVVTTMDALRIINELNRNESRRLPAPVMPASIESFYDVSADNWITPQDVLLVINSLSRALPAVDSQQAAVMDPMAWLNRQVASNYLDDSQGFVPRRYDTESRMNPDEYYSKHQLATQFYFRPSIAEHEDDANPVNIHDVLWDESIDWLSPTVVDELPS